MDLSQYLEIFIDETKEHIQTLNDQVLILEAEPDNIDTVNEIFRAAHSLKGMAGTMGFKRMQRLTHDMENVFSEIRNGKLNVNADMIDIVFKCLDAIEGYLANILESAEKKRDSRIKFTDEGRDEMIDIFAYVTNIYDAAIKMFTTEDESLLEEIDYLENMIDDKQIEYQEGHVRRMSMGKCSIEAGLIFTDLLIGLERIGDHAENIAYSVVEKEKSSAELDD